MVKPIKEILEDSLVVLEYISNTTNNYEKKKKKIKKMISLYEKNPEKFMTKYIDNGDL